MATSHPSPHDPLDLVGDADASPEIDPVCGLEFARAAAAAEAYFDGQHFYFCSDTCKERFDREPARYCVSCVELA